MKARLLKLRCDRCGSRLREGRYVRSAWTKKRYCGELDSCARRARKKARAERRLQAGVVAQA
jgi:hypothetical protein